MKTLEWAPADVPSIDKLVHIISSNNSYSHDVRMQKIQTSLNKSIDILKLIDYNYRRVKALYHKKGADCNEKDFIGLTVRECQQVF
uniref:YdhN protein n=1 Tax=Halalkalibacterium halodurans TaxID=86665 RepID=Q9Z9T6_ALKHA|nr:ydhN [Halalkalibacterium halodurans]